MLRLHLQGHGPNAHRLILEILNQQIDLLRDVQTAPCILDALIGLRQLRRVLHEEAPIGNDTLLVMVQ